MTLPDTRFYLDDGTGTFPTDITLKVLLLNGMTIRRGREDWQGGVSTGELSITLNNADGRFTPGSTILGSPSPIKVDQRIRVKETINGVTFTRFTGYVKSWPVSWPATVATWSTVTITVTDAQARAERQVLKSVIEQEILADSPAAYYTLGEPAGAIGAGDTSGNQQAGLAMAGSGTGVVFGNATGPGTDGLTAAEFAGGMWLTGPKPGTTLQAWEFWFTTTTPGPCYVAMHFWLDASGHLRLGSASGADLGLVTDGLVHHVAVSIPDTKTYLDNVATGVSPAAGNPPTLYVGGADGEIGFTGAVAHVACYGAALSAARVGAHYQAGSTGFAGESGTARITRLAGYASLPVGTLDTSLTNVAFTDITGRSAWEALQQVTDAEMGLLFFDGSGNLTLHNRNRVSAKTAPDLSLDKQYVTPDVQPVTDDQQIVNYLEGAAAGTGSTQVVRNAASETSHGRYSASVEYLVQTDQEVIDRGNWIVTNFAEPTTRYGTLTINLYKMTAAMAQSVLSAIDLNAWLRVTSMPTQNTGGATADVVVQGVTEEQDGERWQLRCNVVSRSLFTAFILDDATHGVLDSDRLYV